MFERVEEAIVLEDDCLPEPTFFAFCDELLERYRDDERVFAISGNDFEYRGEPPAPSYRFSRYPLIWGWATWGRAWRHFDPELEAWPDQRDSRWLERLLGDRMAADLWAHRFDQTYAGDGSWDFAWLHACWTHGGLTALPTTNLVSNLGFRADATNTRVAAEHRSPFAAVPTAPMAFPIVHPKDVERDPDTDDFLEDILFSGNIRRTFARLRDLQAAKRART